MGFTREKFLGLPPASRAKKMADALRTVVLRLGKDWKSTLHQYNCMAQWSAAAQRCLDPQQLQLPVVRDHYLHWRAIAGLGPQRDVAVLPAPGDRENPLAEPVPWEVLAHNLRSGQNIGSLLRTTDCLGLAGVHLSGYSPGPEQATVKAASLGCEGWVSCRRWEDPMECIADARARGLSIVAIELDPEAKPLNSFSWPPRGLVLLGNEELGIPPELLQACTHRVFIPMYGRKASLNVAACFAIVAHEIRCKY